MPPGAARGFREGASGRSRRWSGGRPVRGGSGRALDHSLLGPVLPSFCSSSYCRYKDALKRSGNRNSKGDKGASRTAPGVPRAEGSHTWSKLPTASSPPPAAQAAALMPSASSYALYAPRHAPSSGECTATCVCARARACVCVCVCVVCVWACEHLVCDVPQASTVVRRVHRHLRAQGASANAGAGMGVGVGM